MSSKVKDMENMKIWYMGSNLERLEIKANSFDEALKESETD